MSISTGAESNKTYKRLQIRLTFLNLITSTSTKMAIGVQMQDSCIHPFYRKNLIVDMCSCTKFLPNWIVGLSVTFIETFNLWEFIFCHLKASRTLHCTLFLWKATPDLRWPLPFDIRVPVLLVSAGHLDHLVACQGSSRWGRASH